MTSMDMSCVQALALTADGQLIAGGEFGIDGDATSNVWRWDGRQWTPLSSGVGWQITAIATSRDSAIYAAAQYHDADLFGPRDELDWGVARWTGRDWERLGGFDRRINALLTGPSGQVIVGGEFTSTETGAFGCVAVFDGSEWKPLDSGLHGTVMALAFHPNGTLYAGGRIAIPGHASSGSLAMWDGQRWLRPRSDPGGTVLDIAITPDGEMFLAREPADGVPLGFVRWNGESWSRLPTASLGTVNRVARGPDGSYVALGTESIRRWGGSQWLPLDGVAIPTIDAVRTFTYNAQGFVSADALVVAPDGSVYIGGSFGSVEGIAAENVARWSLDSGWQPLIPRDDHEGLDSDSRQPHTTGDEVPGESGTANTDDSESTVSYLWIDSALIQEAMHGRLPQKLTDTDLESAIGEAWDDVLDPLDLTPYLLERVEDCDDPAGEWPSELCPWWSGLRQACQTSSRFLFMVPLGSRNYGRGDADGESVYTVFFESPPFVARVTVFAFQPMTHGGDHQAPQDLAVMLGPAPAFEPSGSQAGRRYKSAPSRSFTAFHWKYLYGGLPGDDADRMRRYFETPRTCGAWPSEGFRRNQYEPGPPPHLRKSLDETRWDLLQLQGQALALAALKVGANTLNAQASQVDAELGKQRMQLDGVLAKAIDAVESA